MNKTVKRSILVTAIVSVMVGCASSSQNENNIDPTPKRYNAEHSFAYNIADQTALTHYNSPLRDFADFEIDKAHSQVNAKGRKETNVFLGGITVTGDNLMDYLDVGGDIKTNMGNFNHEASYARWIIAVPAENYDSAIDAQNYMLSAISAAAKRAYSNLGQVYEEVTPNRRLIETRVRNDNYDTSLGLNKPVGHEKEVLVTKTQFPFFDGLKEAYVYGINKRSREMNELLIDVPTTVGLIAVKQNPSFDDFYRSITRELPVGFYLYAPSFPRQKLGQKVFTYRESYVPAIYTQGNKFEFKQP